MAASQQEYLSFNPAKRDALELDFQVSPEEVTEELPFQYTWDIWEQVVPQKDTADYSDNTKQIASFSTVQEFWRLWNHMPQPSELLNSKRMVRESEDTLHLVDALMIFKQGVKPMWEDPANASGGHFEYKLGRNLEPGQVDEYWNNLVLGMVGGTMDENGIITGVRLVDKLSGSRGQSGFIRIEVWFKGYADIEARNSLKKAIDACLSTRLKGAQGTVPHGDCRSHMRRH